MTKKPKKTEYISLDYWETKKGGHTHLRTNMRPFRRIGFLMWTVYRAFKELEEGGK